MRFHGLLPEERKRQLRTLLELSRIGPAKQTSLIRATDYPERSLGFVIPAKRSASRDRKNIGASM
jgi:hypothetical protein